MAYTYGIQPTASSGGASGGGTTETAVRTVSHLRSGLVLPFQRDEKNDFANAEGIDVIRSNVRCVLRVRRGQLRWRPRFGCDFWKLKNRNIDETLLETARIYATEALTEWEPRVRVTRVSAIKVPRGTQISVFYDIVQTDAPGRRAIATGLSESIV